MKAEPIISEELLNEVTEHVEVKDILRGKVDNNTYYNIEGINILQCVNNDTLVRMCKSWAYNLGYEILEGAETLRVYRNKLEVYSVTNMCQRDNFEPFDKHYTIKACQWILDK